MDAGGCCIPPAVGGIELDVIGGVERWGGAEVGGKLMGGALVGVAALGPSTKSLRLEEDRTLLITPPRPPHNPPPPEALALSVKDPLTNSLEVPLDDVTAFPPPMRSQNSSTDLQNRAVKGLLAEALSGRTSSFGPRGAETSSYYTS
jgi:hypothetical protein